MTINIFVDMDGVLAVYEKDMVEKMHNKDFFLKLAPQKGNISLVKSLIKDKTLNVYILSSLLEGSPYVLNEKELWLNKYLPEIDARNRLFVPAGIAKSDFINDKLVNIDKATNVLIDDYTVNLLKWKEDGFLALKMLNGANNTTGAWLSSNPDSYLNYRSNPKNNYKKITKIVTKHLEK